MGLMRSLLLWGSRNVWLARHVPRTAFARRAVRRFMPGEDLESALAAARGFQEKGIACTFTRLGEAVAGPGEAEEAARHYLELLERIAAAKLDVEVSLKLTHLGLGLSPEPADGLFRSIARRAAELGNWAWIDMEGSDLTEATIDLYLRARAEVPTVGICLQSYLRRTAGDLERLLAHAPAVRMVKGAYREPREIAFPKKWDVDENFYGLTCRMLEAGARTAIGTHDLRLVGRLRRFAEERGIARERLEFHMLYGIKSREQLALAAEGYRVRTLISYGSSWFPWYMRRLAERPANVGFVLRSLFSR